MPALQFERHLESLATEALGFILEKSATARAAVAEAMRACGAAIDNQPGDAVERLDPGGALLVVAPAARLSVLWVERVHRTINGSSARSRPTLVSAGADAAGDGDTAADLAELNRFLDLMDASAFLPLSSEELTTSHYRRIVEFGNIVDDVATTLVERGSAAASRLPANSGNGYYGRHLDGRRLSAVVHQGKHQVANDLNWLGHPTTSRSMHSRATATTALVRLESLLALRIATAETDPLLALHFSSSSALLGSRGLSGTPNRLLPSSFRRFPRAARNSTETLGPQPLQCSRHA